ncbi:flagellar basal body-associated protein FliL [Apirhabdus apintestini]|uniref:flagellar basal body-associated protein FliL n=1 Tax=Erwinia sp. HR93 TaxID=3094840 RepID=UPI002ADEB8E6|nr:flagellar basal body-associated protein FliL [Erwinia sp. HR93]MEA1063453.1 flagellar basal body-associated protein FliL [Erwinia sp. HR93]WPM85282.1 flagellar basal body-associated protein FliL [Enterobacteriaceae bacterium CA-0114]
MAKTNTQGGKGSKLILSLLILISLLACGLAGFAWYQVKTWRHEDLAKAGNAGGQKQALPVAPIFVPLDTFTVSLNNDKSDGEGVLYIGITLRLTDTQSESDLQLFMPEVRSRLLMLFAEQHSAELNTQEGKEALRQKVKDALSKPFAGQRSIAVSDVLYNAFILR